MNLQTNSDACIHSCQKSRKAKGDVLLTLLLTLHFEVS